MIMDLITARKHTDKIFLEMTDFLDSFLEAGTPGFTLSKPITCTAALMLMVRGAFSLEDTLCSYLPEFTRMYVKSDAEPGQAASVQPAVNQIRIRDLFCMTAGFSYDLNAENLTRGNVETHGACPTREMMRYLAKEPLEFEPGTQFHRCRD